MFNEIISFDELYRNIWQEVYGISNEELVSIFQYIDDIRYCYEETGIQLDGITYWSISDTLDHNLERTNRKTYEQGMKRDKAQTRYAGLYSGLERKQTMMLENKKMYVRKNIETQKTSLIKYQTMYDKAIKNNETKKSEVYGSRIEMIKRRINELENQFLYMREDIPEDLKKRKEIRQSFSKQVAEIIPDGVPMVFHGNNDIATIYEILKSGGLKTPEERGVDFKSFATQIDVANKHDIHVPVEFADPGIDSARPYGAIFAFYPKKDEIYKGLENFGSEVPGGVQSINFKEDDDRFVGIITTEENKERIQKWLQEFGMDYKKIFTHLEFIEMCKDRFKDNQLTNGKKLGEQVVGEIFDINLIDETERTIKEQEGNLDKTKNQATIGG